MNLWAARGGVESLDARPRVPWSRGAQPLQPRLSVASLVRNLGLYKLRKLCQRFLPTTNRKEDHHACGWGIYRTGEGGENWRGQPSRSAFLARQEMWTRALSKIGRMRKEAVGGNGAVRGRRWWRSCPARSRRKPPTSGRRRLRRTEARPPGAHLVMRRVRTPRRG
jgi:hypothetical protein